MRAVIFANGILKNPQSYRDRILSNDLVIAADGGTLHAQAAGVTPWVVIGDQDSLAPELKSELKKAGTRFIDYPAAKDETDLELALLYAVEQGVDEIMILGALGGRLDQTLANLFLLTLPELVGIDVYVIDREQTIFLVRDRATVIGSPGDTVSLIPFEGDATGVTTEGLAWALKDETLRFGPARGVSNVLQGKEGHVQVREGVLLCVIIRRGKFEKEIEDEKT